MSDQANAVATTEEPASIEDRLGALFDNRGSQVTEQEQREEPEAAAEEVAAEDESQELAADDEGGEVEGQPASGEVELEIEWNGEKRVLRGEELRTIAQKGFDAERKWSEAARAREWVQHQSQLLQEAVNFQQTFLGDIAELKAIDGQLQQYEQINWMQAFDSDPVNALKLKEQRDSLREAKNAKLQGLQQKQAQAAQAQATAGRAAMEAEERALLAKVPEWRNSEKAAAEKAKVLEWLGSLGYTPKELSAVSDHRFVIGMRKAMLYDQLQKSRADKAKQVRSAPPLAKPGSANSTPPRVAKYQQIRQRLHKSGDVKDAAAAILSRMK